MPSPDDKDLTSRQRALDNAEAKARNLRAEYNALIPECQDRSKAVSECKLRLSDMRARRASQVEMLPIRIDLKRAEARQESTINLLLEKQEEADAAESERRNIDAELRAFRRAMRQRADGSKSQRETREYLERDARSNHQPRGRETRRQAEDEVNGRQRVEDGRRSAEEGAHRRTRQRSAQQPPEAPSHPGQSRRVEVDARDRATERAARRDEKETPRQTREPLPPRGSDLPRHANPFRPTEAARNQPTQTMPRVSHHYFRRQGTREEDQSAEDEMRSRAGHRSAQTPPTAPRQAYHSQPAGPKLHDQEREDLRPPRVPRHHSQPAQSDRTPRMQNQEQPRSRPPPPPAIPSHQPQPEQDLDIYKAWRSDAEQAFKDYSTITIFPSPPFPDEICSKPGCVVGKANRALKICACDIEKAIKGAGKRIKEERSFWHPDKFSKCGEDVREEFKAKASEVFQVVMRMYLQGKGAGGR